MKSSAVTRERQRGRAVWGSFLRPAPLGGALDTDAANGGFAGLFPRGGPGVFFFALLINPRDHLGCGGKHVAFSSRFHTESDALEDGF